MTLTPEQLDDAQALKYGGKEDRADFCKQLMVVLKWTLQNRRELGNIWDIGPRELAKLGQLANSMIVADIRDPEALRSKLIEQAHFVTSDAMDKKKAFIDKTGDIVLAPDPDHKAALQGLNFIAKMTGLDKAPPAQPKESKYAGKTLPELLMAAQQRLLPDGTSLPDIEIRTEGEEADEEEVEAVEITVSSGNRRCGSEERVRGGNTRRDRDPTGRQRGLNQEGKEA